MDGLWMGLSLTNYTGQLWNLGLLESQPPYLTLLLGDDGIKMTPCPPRCQPSTLDRSLPCPGSSFLPDGTDSPGWLLPEIQMG